MSDHDNDIDALLRLWSESARSDHRRYHRALTALVAELDAAIKERDEAYGLILKWWFLLEIVDDGEIMYARAAEGQRLMDDAEKRAFLAATAKEGGGA